MRAMSSVSGVEKPSPMEHSESEWELLDQMTQFMSISVVQQEAQMMFEEAIEEFAIKFNRLMEEFAIAGAVSAEDSLYDLWDFWEENILPILPVQSSAPTVRNGK